MAIDPIESSTEPSLFSTSLKILSFGVVAIIGVAIVLPQTFDSESNEPQSVSTSAASPTELQTVQEHDAPIGGETSLVAGLPSASIDELVKRGDYPGQPEPGTVLWGASVPGNADPLLRHETPANPYGIRRSFFQWHQATGWLIDTARDDLEHHRLPWVSIKTPSWTAVATGEHDAELDALLMALIDLQGPVWLTLHHEPEGGNIDVGNPDDPGGAPAHVAMNAHVRERIDALNADNLSLLPVLMAWTFNPESGRDPDQWWSPDIYDLLGIDMYNQQGSPSASSTWDEVRVWAHERGVDIALGEWGTLAEDSAPLTQLHDTAANSWKDAGRARVTALAYWDQDDRSGKPWSLDGPRLTAFTDLLDAPISAHWTDEFG